MSKTILVTGATDGIGKLSALELAKQGHKLILHGRNSEKLCTVVDEVKKLNVNVKGYVADFSKLDSVKQMAEAITADYKCIDVILNNAGVFKSANTTGLDIRIVVNYFAQYLLTNSLLPLMKSKSDARIINLSSAAQSEVSIDLLKGKKQVSQSESYAQSKLALTMWSFRLAKELENVSVIAVNPGSLLNTKMANEAYGQYWSPATKGADLLVGLCTSEKFKGVTGKYFDNDRGGFGEAHPDAYNHRKIEQLIKITEEMLS